MKEGMMGVEKNHVELMIRLLGDVYSNFMHSEARELSLASRDYGKGDTLGLDAIPEIVYIEGVEAYDNLAIFVTEETDKITRE